MCTHIHTCMLTYTYVYIHNASMFTYHAYSHTYISNTYITYILKTQYMYAQIQTERHTYRQTDRQTNTHIHIDRVTRTQ